MQKDKKAFTLIELLVAIAVIGIIAVGATSINFNNISDKQRINGFSNKIKTNIETVKNNVLIGREVNDGVNLIVSNKWEIEFNNSSGGTIKTYYYDNSDIKKSYPLYDIIPERYYEIKTKNDGLELSDFETASIMINGRKLKLKGITTNDKILEIELKYKSSKKTLRINTISGVIEEK